jgi:hypothetical protein
MNMEASAFHQQNQLLQFEAVNVVSVFFVHRLVIFEIRECEARNNAYQNSQNCIMKVGQ